MPNTEGRAVVPGLSEDDNLCCEQDGLRQNFAWRPALVGQSEHQQEIEVAQKQPMQANGQDSDRRHSDGVGDTDTHGKKGGGESSGGNYPNPHRGKEPQAKPESFLGHGGQTEIGYHGPEQLGDQNVGEDDNPNSATKSG